MGTRVKNKKIKIKKVKKKKEPPREEPQQELDGHQGEVAPTSPV